MPREEDKYEKAKGPYVPFEEEDEISEAHWRRMVRTLSVLAIVIAALVYAVFAKQINSLFTEAFFRLSL